MKTDLKSFKVFYNAVCDDELVFMFGTGISAALTGESISWYKWISDGISGLKDRKLAKELSQELDSDSSADNLIRVVGKVIEAAKIDNTYSDWMHVSFEIFRIRDISLMQTLKKLTGSNDVFITTNYDLLLEQATGLKPLSYEQPKEAFEMLKSGRTDSVIHIHGIYDSAHHIDNIVADKEQYDAVLNNKGAQFIQNILGTRTLVFVGCGKTTEDVNVRQFVEFAKKYLKMDCQYYFLYNSASVIEGFPDNIQLIPYGDDYGDLPGFLEDIANERIKHKVAKTRLIGRTAFDKVEIVNDSLLRYHFSQREIPFCGREQELSKLKDFIDTDDSFSWWAITGQAGAGKSRLVYEFLFLLPPSWFGFFVNDRFIQHDVETYDAFCDTVVVIDYVAGRERQVAELAVGFADRFKRTGYKLRILLIERENGRDAGTWYSKMLQRCGRTDAESIKRAEYSDRFLNLGDLRREDIERLIGCVCQKNGLREDTNRDVELYEIYGQKFERLRHRPLYLQLFVEGWIANGGDTPKYDSYSDLLEDLLKREQEKWLICFDNDQEVCNACVRLLIRANIAPLDLDHLDDYYKADWEMLRNYIGKGSFSGKQRNLAQDTMINSLCQNIDNSHKMMAPQFPDIIKEYMFSYYTDIDRLPEIMREIWINAAAPFSTFILRCLMDFEDQDFYRKALHAYQISTNDTEVLIGRLSMLQNRLIQKGEDPYAYWSMINNEHEFWSSVAVPEDEEKKDHIAGLKVTGLYKVAQQIGAWSAYDVSEMMSVIDEMLEVQGGLETAEVKKLCLSKTVEELSKASFFDESKKLREKLEELLSNSDASELDEYYRIQNANAEMVDLLVSGNHEAAADAFLKLSRNKKAHTNLHVGRFLASSCFSYAYFSFFHEYYDAAKTGYAVIYDLKTCFPDDPEINARTIGCRGLVLQADYFAGKIDDNTLRQNLEQLNSELQGMQFKGDETDEALSISWGIVKNLWFNIASQEEVENILQETVSILQINPKASEVVDTRIIATRILHEKYYSSKISHGEVEDLYRYVEMNPESETVREDFYKMLDGSEDAGHFKDYLNPDIVREAFQDARYNPVSGSGIPEIDLQEALMQGTVFAPDPVVREKRKVGRNELCPCGSGKKFKQCCLGKGIYD